MRNARRRWVILCTCFWRGTGQAQGLPLPVRGGGRGSRRGTRAGTRPAPTGPRRWKRESTRDQGRHKACPYRSAAVEGGVDAGPGQAQGLPLPVRGGGRGSRRGTRAGTRPAPTGPGRWKGESTRDQGRHKACPYRSGAVEGGVDAGLGQAQGLPLPVRDGGRGSRRRTRAGTRPAQSLGRQFQLAESRLTLGAFLGQIEQIMDEVETV